jgi:hypothetical protein
MTSRLKLQGIPAIAAILLATACGSGMLDVGYPTGVTGGGGGATAGTSATYDGVLADSSRHGRLTMKVSTTLVATGTLTFIGGPTVTVTGAVDTVAQQLTASGGGYAVTAFPFHGTLQGTYTGPAGTAVGFLAATSDSLTQMTHTSYCGNYNSTNGNGWFSMVVLSDGDTGGFAVQTVGSAVSQSFTGTLLSGLTFSGITSHAAPITGTVSGSAITGSYSPPIGSTAGTGTFSVSVGGC